MVISSMASHPSPIFHAASDDSQGTFFTSGIDEMQSPDDRLGPVGRRRVNASKPNPTTTGTAMRAIFAVVLDRDGGGGAWLGPSGSWGGPTGPGGGGGGV